MENKKENTIKKTIVHSLEHPIETTQTIEQKTANKFTEFIGSWKFLIAFLLFNFLWILANLYAWIKTWDPYPFILLNLILAMITAIQTPIILMSQNRANQKHNLKAEYDYQVNRKSEKEIEEIKKQLDRIERKLR